MAKYEVITPVSHSNQADDQPGDIIELEDDIAAVLMEKGAVRPAILSEEGDPSPRRGRKKAEEAGEMEIQPESNDGPAETPAE